MKCGLFHEIGGKKGDSTKMTNPCAMVSTVQNPPKMNLVDDVTEKISCLRITRDSEDTNDKECQINIHTSAEEEEEEEEDRKETEEDEEDEEEREDSEYNDKDEDDEDDDDDLIKRGPMRSQVFLATRNQPYNIDQSLALNINDNALLDKIVENIQRELELHTLTKDVDWNCCTDGKDKLVPQVCVSKNKFATLDVNNSTENLLPHNLVHDNFQTVQRVSENSDAYCLQEYQESSYLAYDQSTTSQLNFNQSLIDFPSSNDPYSSTSFDPSINAVGPANSLAYRPSQVSSFSPSSSSPSSNHSLTDSSSPYSCQVSSCNPQLDEQLDQYFENFAFKEPPTTAENGAVNDKELLNILLEELTSSPATKLDAVSDINFSQTNNFHPNSTLDPSYCPSYSDLVPPSSSPCNDSSSASVALVDNFQTTLTDDSYIPRILRADSCPAPESLPVNRKSDRNSMPWALLNLPPGSSSVKLTEQVSSKQVEEAMKELLKRPDKELAQQDKDGDTMLMCLVGNADEFVRKKAYLAPLVERLSTMKGALTMANNRGEDALHLAAINLPKFPYVAGYLAAKMLQKNIDVSQRLYHTSGNTLTHSIAERGDSHAAVLAVLLALRTSQRNAVFDLSKRNYDGKTALHVAIECQAPSLTSVKLLLKHGADPRMRETRCDDTALHAACRTCDPALVKVILDACGSELVNAMNRNHDTPLHVAATATTKVPARRQAEVCRLLIHFGGNANLANRQGKIPLDLVPVDRQETIQKIFYARP